MLIKCYVWEKNLHFLTYLFNNSCIWTVFIAAGSRQQLTLVVSLASYYYTEMIIGGFSIIDNWFRGLVQTEISVKKTSISIYLLVCGKTGIRDVSDNSLDSNRDDPKIIGGTDASKGDAPWQVGLVRSSTRDCVHQSQVLFSYFFKSMFIL
jgi:hypothetical protein